jgi:hypothetical protein
MIHVNNETHPFIDLPNLELPVTWEELFDEEDLEVVNGDCQLKKVVHTTNFEWMPNLSEHSPPSILGLIHSNKVSRMLWEWFHDNTHNDLLAPIRKSQTGKNYFPITMLKFHGTSLWHREGYPYWTDGAFRKLLNGRNNYAFNFPFYGEVEKTSVKFGKGDPQLESMFEGLLKEHVNTHITGMFKQGITNQQDLANSYIKDMSVATVRYGAHTGLTMDHLLDAKLEQQLTILGEKVKYDSPYCIPLSSWHKVDTTGGNRLSLRFMGNNEYTFSDICEMYDNNKLFK